MSLPLRRSNNKVLTLTIIKVIIQKTTDHIFYIIYIKKENRHIIERRKNGQKSGKNKDFAKEKNN